MGNAGDGVSASAGPAACKPVGGWREKLVLATLVAGILAVNAFTIWVVRRPSKTLAVSCDSIALRQAEPAFAAAGNLSKRIESLSSSTKSDLFPRIRGNDSAPTGSFEHPEAIHSEPVEAAEQARLHKL